MSAGVPDRDPEESPFNPSNRDYFEQSDHDVAATFGN